jgi:hypothetical protein
MSLCSLLPPVLKVLPSNDLMEIILLALPRPPKHYRAALLDIGSVYRPMFHWSENHIVIIPYERACMAWLLACVAALRHGLGSLVQQTAIWADPLKIPIPCHLSA